MADEIQHEAEAQVKKDGGRAQLVRLLHSTSDQVSSLQAQLDEIQERIDPSPAPLPPTIDPNVLFMRLELREEKLALNKAAEALGREVEEFRQAARRLRLKLTSGRNARAWGKMLGRLDEEARLHQEALDTAMRALIWHTDTVAALVTFAQADNLPESIGKEEETGNE